MIRGLRQVRRSVFFFNDTATTEIYTLSLHDALPICSSASACEETSIAAVSTPASTISAKSDWSSTDSGVVCSADRKSTRLNSSHANISYAVFCLKKKTVQSCPQLSKALTNAPAHAPS